MLAWGLVQPWLLWPSLVADISHRLTLVCLSVACGLTACWRVGVTKPLPASCGVVVAGALAVRLWHGLPTIREATYFETFIETAFFADGLLVVVAVVWGLWALRQLPLAWWRRLRWVGVVMCAANLIASWPWGGRAATGLMGIDRLLGAYAVLWLPILAAWRWWLAALPLTLIALCGKEMAWVGVLAIVVWRWPRRMWWLVPVGLAIAVVSAERAVLIRGEHPADVSKVVQRLQTWGPTWSATLQHPFAGWGFSPMAFSRMSAAVGARLPSVHSDWLSLAFHAGWIVFGLMAWAVGSMLRTRSVTPWQRALQESVVGIGVMALGQSVVSHARIAGTLLLLLVWWWVECDHAKEIG